MNKLYFEHEYGNKLEKINHLENKKKKIKKIEFKIDPEDGASSRAMGLIIKGYHFLSMKRNGTKVVARFEMD